MNHHYPVAGGVNPRVGDVREGALRGTALLDVKVEARGERAQEEAVDSECDAGGGRGERGDDSGST